MRHHLRGVVVEERKVWCSLLQTDGSAEKVEGDATFEIMLILSASGLMHIWDTPESGPAPTPHSRSFGVPGPPSPARCLDDTPHGRNDLARQTSQNKR